MFGPIRAGCRSRHGAWRFTIGDAEPPTPVILAGTIYLNDDHSPNDDHGRRPRDAVYALAEGGPGAGGGRRDQRAREPCPVANHSLPASPRTPCGWGRCGVTWRVPSRVPSPALMSAAAIDAAVACWDAQ